MSRKKFDEIESQIRDIGLKHWKRLNGRMIRSAAFELRNEAIVLFGNNCGNIYMRKEWDGPIWWDSLVTKNTIGLYLNPDKGKVVELNMTEVKIMEQAWRNV